MCVGVCEGTNDVLISFKNSVIIKYSKSKRKIIQNAEEEVITVSHRV